jgi:predicted  nucleic acid-binding Zn-ribbon protein
LLVIVALVSSGVWPFLQALLKRRSDVRQSDAQTTTITVQGAEVTVSMAMKLLERAEARERTLEERLATREAKITELEAHRDDLTDRLRTTRADLREMQVELEVARRQLAVLHETR